MSAKLDLTGQRMGHLTVIESAGIIRSGRRSKVLWRCRCSCGNECKVRTEHLRSGHTASCGCVQRCRSREYNTIHGLRSAPEYVVWKGMRDRCRNPKHMHWDKYGGRGISVCSRWDSFSAFLADMGPRPSSKHQIERKNNDLGYSPDNCVWATKKEQASNTRRNVFVTINGRSMILADACRELGITYRQSRRKFGEEVRRVQD